MKTTRHRAIAMAVTGLLALTLAAAPGVSAAPIERGFDVP